MATISQTGPSGDASGATGNKMVASPEKYTTIGTLLEHNAPDNRDLLIKTFGDQGITGFLKLTGAVKNGGTADQVQYWEEERRHKLQSWSAASDTGADGLAIVDVGDDADVVVRSGDVVMDASTGTRWRVLSTNIAGDFVAPETAVSGTAGFLKLAALDGNTTQTALATSGTFIAVGNIYDQGTEQPSRFVETSPTLRTNPYMIIKDVYKVNGSQATNIGWVNLGGDYRWFMHGEQETRARFMDKREMMMLFANKADGTSNLNINTGTNDTITGVAGSEGYFEAVESRGIVSSGGNANPIDSFAELDDIIIELDKQGAPAEYACYLNRKQDLAFDDMLASGVSTGVTAGLAGQFGAFQNSPDLAVQLGFKSFTRGGYTFHKHDWKLLNDPTLLGASTQYMGAMVPMTQVTDPRTGTKAPALEMNYKESNGYSRELEHWVRGGGVLGHTNITEDVAEFHYRSEINLITRAPNQHVALKG